jgi:C1A family cysteine protease
MPIKNTPQQIIDATQDIALARQFNVSPAPNHRVQHMTDQIVNNQYSLNWTPDRADARDYLFSLSAGTNTPASIDLRNYCSPVDNQGTISSCTGCAITSAIELILNKEQRFIDISRLFIYYQERLMESSVNSDSGAYIRDGIKACYTYGAPAEKLWAYNPRLVTVRPSDEAYADAIKRKVVSYWRCTNFDSVKSALALGYPVIIGFLVYSSFFSLDTIRTGIMKYPNTKIERLLGGHAVCLVGYNDRTQMFIAKNSWGTNWGSRGYFYMPYRVIQDPSMSQDFWVISGITK